MKGIFDKQGSMSIATERILFHGSNYNLVLRAHHRGHEQPLLQETADADFPSLLSSLKIDCVVASKPTIRYLKVCQ